MAILPLITHYILFSIESPNWLHDRLCILIHCYLDFAETDITCYIHYYITNCIKYCSTEHFVYDYIIAIYIYIYIYIYICIYWQHLCNMIVYCYMTHCFKYTADYVLLQHGYIVLKDTYTICYITRYTTLYIVDRYSNITKDITKPMCYITLNIPKVNMIHIQKINIKWDT